MNENIDPRFSVAGAYIRHRKNILFRDIFNVVPKNLVARELCKKAKKFNEIVADPTLLKVKELVKMSELFGCEPELLNATISRQVEADGIVI
jgi:hypothetical protein